MGGCEAIRERVAKDPGAARTVRAIVASWRALTGGNAARDQDRRTLVACSGGADSSALVLALASASREVVVAHVVHDLRDEASVLGDRDATRRLADLAGAAFVEARVAVRSLAGNAEGNARRARYEALSRLARERGCAFVATGHQADDQAELVLMRLMRGAGPDGLGGMRSRRRLGGVALVRPMLGTTRVEGEAVCRSCGVEWREDATNRDVSRLRAYVRHEVMPRLVVRAPEFSRRAGDAAGLIAGAARVVRERAEAVLEFNAMRADGGLVLGRGDCRKETLVVVGEVVRLAHEAVAGRAGVSRLSRRAVERVARALGDGEGRPRTFTLGGVTIEVRSREVVVRRRAESADPGPGDGGGPVPG